MVSWAQSRGRARKQRSSFVLMHSDALAFAPTMKKWEDQEQEMTRLYNTGSELHCSDEDQPTGDEDEGGGLRFTVEETG
jgi:hypothetical protein